jgi:hypothetical protein
MWSFAETGRRRKLVFVDSGRLKAPALSLAERSHAPLHYFYFILFYLILFLTFYCLWTTPRSLVKLSVAPPPRADQ